MCSSDLHLPKVAGHADKFSLLRNFTHSDSGHGSADHRMLTGYAPRPGFNGSLKPNNQRPAHGAIISRMFGPRGSVPPYVCLPKMHNSAGAAYLGTTAAPFVVNADPNAPGFSVPDLVPPLAVDPKRFGARRQLLGQIDRYKQAAEIEANRGAKALTTFQQKAFDLISSPETKAAFDIKQESDTLRDEYGRSSLGQSCLMARRLVEAGVKLVTVYWHRERKTIDSSWDTHLLNFTEPKPPAPPTGAGR
mgnify:CR=1 FL=1